MKNLVLLISAAFSLAPLYAADALRIYVIDVEGGGSTLVIAPSGQSMLIDSGSAGPAGDRDAKRIAAVMKDAGLKKIDYLFTTHYDGDHVGGAPNANQTAHFDRFFDHGEIDSKWEQNKGWEDRYKDYLAISSGRRTIVKAGDVVPLKGVRADVVASQGAVLSRAINGGGKPNPYCQGAEVKPPNMTENSQSAGVLISFHKFTFLDIGDLTWDKEQELACPVNKIGHVSLLLAAHHGFFADMSGAPALLWGIRPQVVIANNGPRKGMAASAYDKIEKVEGLEGLWQSHLALASDKAHNTSDDMIANSEASTECKGNWIKVDVQANGNYSITNGRNHFTKTYKTR
jgi:beta-lactamase superfamily II metal-dependent hydrolase